MYKKSFLVFVPAINSLENDSSCGSQEIISILVSRVSKVNNIQKKLFLINCGSQEIISILILDFRGLEYTKETTRPPLL